MKRLVTTIAIAASPAAVWAALIDLERYPAWNPFITSATGDLREGGRLRVRIAPPGGRPMTFKPTVTVVDPERRLEWLGHLGVPGLFDGRHAFTLEEGPDGATHLTQEESFSGALVALLGGSLQRTEAGFVAMNEALRDLVEPTAVPQ